MLGRTLRMAFWATYDHVGKLFLANLICVLAIVLPGALAFSALMTNNVPLLMCGAILLIITAAAILPAAMSGLTHMATQIINTRDGSLADFFTGVRLHWRPAVRLGVLYWAAVFCLLTSAWFYVNMLQGKVPWLGFALSALSLWCLLFVNLTAMLVMPALVQKKRGPIETVKLAAMLVLDNPIFALGLALQFLALAAVSVIVPPLLFFLSGSAAAVLATAAYEQLARKYALIEARKAGGPVTEDGVPLDGFAHGIRVIAKNGNLVIDEDGDDYLNRGARDFMFPWKG